MFALKMRMYLLLAVLFAIIYAIMTMIGTALGMNNFYFYLFISIVLMFIQYMIGPKMVEWSMGVKYISENEYPELNRMVTDLAVRAGIPRPKIGIAAANIPNAFAFGRWASDGRVCVTRGIMDLLNEEELKAVLAHEISHLKNRDVLTITILSVIPMILYRLAWSMMWSGGGRRREEGGNTALIGVAAFLFYFITNLLVLYASRIREYFADKGSVELGSSPSALASALYKLVYGSARMDKEELRASEGLRAFFVNDPARALSEIKELRELDADKSGTIDSGELASLREKHLRLNFGDRMMEVFSTHPNMLKRIKKLSEH